MYLGSFAVEEAEFQSLIGILMNCNPLSAASPFSFRVSIPNRDFDELQLRVGSF